MRTLASIPHGGELVPVGWSPDGEKLLFFYNGGRGLCGEGPSRRPLRSK